MKSFWVVLVILMVGFVQAEELVLTADADADIRSAASAGRGFNRDVLLIGNNGDPAAKQSAKAYVRFKLPEGFGKITQATFTMTRAHPGVYGSNHEVYGLNDGRSELKWVEANGSGVSWRDAPGNVVDSPCRFKDASLVGRFKTLKAADGGRAGDTWSISGPALVKFLNEDSNGYVTLMVGRTQKSSSFDQWASKENDQFSGPTLTISNTPPGKKSANDAAAGKSGVSTSTDSASKRWHEWRTSRKEFPLAAWSYFYRYPGTIKEYQLYKGAGLNFVQAPVSQAENAHAAGLNLALGAFQAVHEDTHALADLVKFANEHPQWVAAYSLKDEPVPNDFAKVGQAVSYIYAHDTSGALPIIDFRANWSVPYKRWQMTYETCFDRFVDEVHPSVLLNCHYPLKRDGTTRPSFYANIEYFRHMALQKDIGLMGFIQVTAHTFKNNPEIDYRTPSESDLNWLVNSHLAYGAQGLWYYNWRIKDERFSEGMVTGETDEPTALYAMVQKMNKRVSALGPTLMKLKSQVVAHTDEIVPEGTTRYAPGMIKGIYDFEGKSFILAQFADQDNQSDNAVYLMIVNKLHAADTASAQLAQTVSFKIYPDYSNILYFDLKSGSFRKAELSDGGITLNPGGGEAAFFILKEF